MKYIKTSHYRLNFDDQSKVLMHRLFFYFILDLWIFFHRIVQAWSYLFPVKLFQHSNDTGIFVYVETAELIASLDTVANKAVHPRIRVACRNLKGNKAMGWLLEKSICNINHKICIWVLQGERLPLPRQALLVFPRSQHTRWVSPAIWL